MKKVLLVVAAVGLGSALALAGDFKGHPNLRKAHNHVEEAIKHLQDAKNGATGDPFGGHRDQAEQLLHQALDQINQAGQFAEQHPGGAH